MNKSRRIGETMFAIHRERIMRRNEERIIMRDKNKILMRDNHESPSQNKRAWICENTQNEDSMVASLETLNDAKKHLCRQKTFIDALSVDRPVLCKKRKTDRVANDDKSEVQQIDVIDLSLDSEDTGGKFPTRDTKHGWGGQGSWTERSDNRDKESRAERLPAWGTEAYQNAGKRHHVRHLSHRENPRTSPQWQRRQEYGLGLPSAGNNSQLFTSFMGNTSLGVQNRLGRQFARSVSQQNEKNMSQAWGN
ncbi:uncharacterized protein N7511_008215 [Penicillium nucicola]|uniref:uncharacterized protein n=1 Tax=Penicillium nucicola TaxID=1850975 RepID=UPI002544D49F|nr:uncharacterized protein N7511_008215 [Penicillium nucicola]KAJ5754062.1 hypothetical protein N7511_008215 [Penicillium nucicola]